MWQVYADMLMDQAQERKQGNPVPVNTWLETCLSDATAAELKSATPKIQVNGNLT